MKNIFRQVISILSVVFLLCSALIVFGYAEENEELISQKRVLLIEDNLPWSSNSNSQVLDSLNADYEKISTSEFHADLLDEFGVIILANDQTTETYGAYGSFTSQLEMFVRNGGTVVYGACDKGWGGNGDLSSELPGGVRKVTEYIPNCYISDSSHPIVTGILTDSQALTDDDLYGNWCSHVYFLEDTLPVGSNVILRSCDNNAPTLVEYPLGEGLVIASGLTWEYYYVRSGGPFAQIAMDDYFAYAIQFHNSIILFDVDNLGMHASFKYNDSYFGTSSYIYNHELAKSSLGLALAAMISDNTYQNPGAAEKMFLDDLSFDHYTPYNYESVPEMNSIACVIASKNVEATNTSIIAIGIRGGGYEGEWGGNFNVGTGDHHKGFERARDSVLAFLNSFLDQNGDDIKYKSNVKFWITGYSRAAATANLVSAYLDEGPINNELCGRLSSYEYDASDIFAYTFETPRNTTASNCKSAVYNNIFNIINREDPVPRLAPAAFAFKRYGKDCYLPSIETNNTIYYRILERVKTCYKDICGKDYDEANEEFKFYELGFSLFSGFTESVNPTISKGVYIDNLISYIASGIGSRSNYVNNGYQTILTKLFFASKGNTDMMAKIFTEAFQKALEGTSNWIDIIKNIKPIVAETLYNALKDNGFTKEDADTLTNSLFDDMLDDLIMHPNYLYSTYKNGMHLMDAHYTQVTLAWMFAIDGDYKESGDSLSKILTGGETYRVATINCPVDVMVYDADGNLRASVKDKQVEAIAECPLAAFVDDDGQITICLPNDGEYNISIIGTDEGVLSASFADYSFEEGKKLQSLNYYDIPIIKGSEVSASINLMTDKGVVNDVDLEDVLAEEPIEPSEVVDYSSADTFIVTVSTENPFAKVIGGGKYYPGEFAKVITESSVPCAPFKGWMENGEIVSTESDYKFRVDSSRALTAVYLEPIHTLTETTEKEATCTDDGNITYYTCSVCKKTFSDTKGTKEIMDVTVKATGHSFSEWEVTKKATTAEEGIETRNCSKCGKEETRSIEKLKIIYTLGDVDGDGNISAADARLALRRSVGLENCEEGSPAFLACDVDLDGNVSAADARLILRASVGLEDPKTWVK